MNKVLKNINNIFNRGKYLGCLSCASVLCILIIILMPVDRAHAVIKIEPFLYLLFLLVFIRQDSIKGAGAYILIGLYFLKMCFMPIIEIKGGFFSSIFPEIYMPYWTQACLAIAGEWLICAICICLNHKYRVILGKRENRLGTGGEVCKPKRQEFKMRNHKVIFIVMMIFVVISCGCILIIPDLMKQFFFAWKDDTTVVYLNTIGASPIYYLFKWCVERGKILLSLWITVYLLEKNRKEYDILCIVLAVFVGLWFTEYRMMGILTSITMIFYYMVHEKNRVMNKFLRGLLFVGIIVIIFWATAMNQLDQSWAAFGRKLDNYCGGYIITAGAMGCRLPNGLFLLFSSVYNQSFVLSGLFSALPEVCDTYLYRHLNIGAYGSFYEMSAQAFATLGVLAPLGIALLVKLILYMDNRFKKEKNPLYEIIYIFVAVSNSVYFIMYTFSMNISHILYFDGLLLLLVYIDKRLKL